MQHLLSCTDLQPARPRTARTARRSWQRIWGLALWLGLIGLACPPAAALMPGEHPLSLRHGARERGYIVHVPAAYRADRPAPLVLALHGGGGSMDLMARDRLYGLVTQSEASGWIVVFPNGYSRLGGKLATWNAGICCGAARDRGSDDVGFLRAVVADVQRRLAIDPQRIFATGMSNGGMILETAVDRALSAGNAHEHGENWPRRGAPDG